MKIPTRKKLTWTSLGFLPLCLIALLIASTAPCPDSEGAVMWYASPEQPYPTSSAYISAPLRFACSNSSRIRTAQPSAMTKPDRRTSKGLEARWGLSLKLVERERARAKPAMERGWRQDSEPPAIYRIWCCRLECQTIERQYLKKERKRGRVDTKGEKLERSHRRAYKRTERNNYHYIGIPKTNKPSSITNWMRPSCTRSSDRMIGTLKAIFHTNMPSSHINQQLRHKQWCNLSVSLKRKIPSLSKPHSGTKDRETHSIVKPYTSIIHLLQIPNPTTQTNTSCLQIFLFGRRPSRVL